MNQKILLEALGLKKAYGPRLLLDPSRVRTYEGTLDEMERADATDHDRKAMELEITMLQMRMAALVSRMSTPKKRR